MTTSKIAFDDVKGVFLAKEWNSFHLSWKDLQRIFFCKCILYLKQPLTPPQHKIVVA